MINQKLGLKNNSSQVLSARQARFDFVQQVLVHRECFPSKRRKAGETLARYQAEPRKCRSLCKHMSACREIENGNVIKLAGL